MLTLVMLRYAYLLAPPYGDHAFDIYMVQLYESWSAPHSAFASYCVRIQVTCKLGNRRGKSPSSSSDRIMGPEHSLWVVCEL